MASDQWLIASEFDRLSALRGGPFCFIVWKKVVGGW